MPPVALDEGLATLVQAGIRIPCPADLTAYLIRYPDLLPALGPVAERVAAAFPSDARLSLELYRDREIEDEYLALYVRQQSYASDILQRIELISAELQPQLDSSQGWLLITTDFQPRQ